MTRLEKILIWHIVSKNSVYLLNSSCKIHGYDTKKTIIQRRELESKNTLWYDFCFLESLGEILVFGSSCSNSVGGLLVFCFVLDRACSVALADLEFILLLSLA